MVVLPLFLAVACGYCIGPALTQERHANRQAAPGCFFPLRLSRFFAHHGNVRIFPGMKVPDGAELRFHCEPVGELIFGGPNSAFCNNGSWSWTTEEPHCYELKRGDVAMEIRTESYTGPGGIVYVEPGKEVEVLCYTRSEHRVALSRLPDAKENQTFRIQYVGDQWNSVLGIFEVAADEVIHLICTREDWARRREIVIVGRYKHNCPLPPPGNGLIIKTTTKGNFEFSCEAQYKLQGRKRVYCLPHGEWQHPLPSCDPAPARPSNCSMSHVHRLQRRTTTDRSTASTLPVVAEDVDGIRAQINDCQIKVDHLDKLLNESETRNLRMMEQIRVLQEEIRRLERN